MHKFKIADLSSSIKALGAVYGDIGTSPLYTLAVLVVFVPLTPNNVIEILSMLVWTLTILVSIQYAWLAMSVSSNGEGGAIVLAKALSMRLKNKRLIGLVSILSVISVALLIGDGVITPAISILSAVEGSKLIPIFSSISQTTIVIISIAITTLLFAVQSRGVESISRAFGPIMLVWFLVIAITGIWHTAHNLSVLAALNPMYAILFIIDHPIIAFIMLGDVILCATGGEALYADMGQLGRKPILRGWFFVFICLTLCYFGQGAFVIANPAQSANPLFGMVQDFIPFLYAPFVVLAVMATIIASQAMISGIFSVVYQLINIRALPRLKVTYTSSDIQSQIYIGFINWFLFVCVVAMLIMFQTSASLAAAYGLAVAGAMSLTGMFLFFVFAFSASYVKMFFALLCAGASCAFFASCLLKIPDGGFWSLIIASVPFFVIMMYKAGQERLNKAFQLIDRKEFLAQFQTAYKEKPKLDGAAIFFIRTTDQIPAYVTKTMFYNGILYEQNVMVMFKIEHHARGIEHKMIDLQDGLKFINIKAGYMEVVEPEEILKSYGIDERAIFYGQEEIASSRLIWKLYALVKTVSPSFVAFYKFPQEKLIGVIRRYEL